MSGLKLQEREPPLGVHDGIVVWLTGLSGAGKSTLAREVAAQWRQRQANVILVDGDEFRALIGDDLGHGPDERRLNAFRIARFCRFLSGQGQHVVCATMSLFQDCRDWNRRHLPGYLEVYVRVPLSTLVTRDPKGLYRRALAGETGGVVGVDLPFDEPRTSDLVIDNIGPAEDLPHVATQILVQAQKILLI